MLVGVVLLFAALVLQLALSARANSITWDEDDHIYAGYMSWKRADFGLNPEHPPLVKMLAALPLLSMDLKLPPLEGRFFKHEAFLGGKDFIFRNDYEAILFRARMAAALLTVLLVLLAFLAAREMFGWGAAVIALALLVFDPNLIAHGAFVGTDVGLSCFMFAAVYAFYRYVKAPTIGRLVLVGLATGLALASKHTAILVLPMLFFLAVCEVFGTPDTEAQARKNRALKLAVALAVTSVIALGVLWAAYGFRYQARAGGRQLNPPLTEFLQGLSRPHDIRLLQTVAHWKLLPESYIYGLADVRIMSDFYTSYLFGKIYPHGVWFYFPAAFAIKSSLTFLILCGVGVWAIASRRFRAKREILFLTIPPAFHLAVAMYSGMNIGVRHILPMYIFLAVLLAGAAWKLIQQNRRWVYVVVALLVFQAISTTRVFPAYVAYANEFWGGPSQTYKYLTDSNADWGQQLKSVKRYLEQRGVKDCWFVYFAQGVVDFRDYGIPCKPLPTNDSLWVDAKIDAPPVIDGTVLISAGDLSGFEFGAAALNPYEQFKHLPARDVIDYGVFVFEGRFEIPLAAAISRSQKARDLLAAQQLPEALTEAQQAVSLAPDSVRANAVLGDVLSAMQRPEEARQAYQKAVTLARTIAPEFQAGWIDGLEKKVAGQ
jgi:Dolichyl-phosphate-mannose-protein mannosyltransferase